MTPLTKLITYTNLEMSGGTKRFLVSAKQGDKATRFIIAKLLNNGEQYVIPEGARVVINIKKPDGKHVYNTCEYSATDVTIELTNQALAAAGTAYCDLEIRSSDDTQIISSASFTAEIEESMRSDSAILSTNEFTDLENRIASHIKSLNDTEENVKIAENLRVEAEEERAEAETLRKTAEAERTQNENLRIAQEKKRLEDTSQAVANAGLATQKAVEATKTCTDITEQAEAALQDQQQLEATLNSAIQIHQMVSHLQQNVELSKQQVEADKAEINETIRNSLLAESSKILESVKAYYERAEALYTSMHIDCDGETPYLRALTPIKIDGATPQVRNASIGVDFDGGTPMSRLLAA